MSDKKQLTAYPLRMPAELREDLEALAKLNKRSLNAEIVARLEYSIDDPDELGRTDKMLLSENPDELGLARAPRPIRGVDKQRLLDSIDNPAPGLELEREVIDQAVELLTKIQHRYANVRKSKSKR